MWGCWCDLLPQIEADRIHLLSYLLAHLLSAAGRKIWDQNADATRSSIPRWRQLGRTCLLAARDGAVLCSTPCFSWSAAVLSLRADLRESLSTRERQSKSVALRLARGTHEPAVLMLIIARAFFWFSFFSPLPLPGAAGLKKYAPAHRGRGVACTVLERTPSAGQCRRHSLGAAGGFFSR